MIRFAEFSQFPGGSLRAQGDHSGQQFREDVLTPALREAGRADGMVIVNLDGTMGLSTAFSREAFGGLVSKDGFSADQLKRLLRIEGSEPSSQIYISEAWDYILTASAPAVSLH
jgi:hypothetical protein